MATKVQIGDNIKASLELKGKTQAWLAREMNISRQHVNKWCNNKIKPDTKHLSEVANLLDLSVEELIKGSFNNSMEKTVNSVTPRIEKIVDYEKKSINMVLDELANDNLTTQQKKAFKSSIISKIDFIIDLLKN